MKNFIDPSPKKNECRDHNKIPYKEIPKTQSSVLMAAKERCFVMYRESSLIQLDSPSETKGTKGQIKIFLFFKVTF
jgi:hypothetical protein